MDPMMRTEFEQLFHRPPTWLFTAPGRTELGGNHTDHQQGCVLAGGVDLLVSAAVAENDTGTVRLASQGYGKCQVSLYDLAPVEQEKGTTAALVRGMASGISGDLRGLDIYVSTKVPAGSGLSSSAATEILLGTIFNHCWNGDRMGPVAMAKLAQRVENEYFGKPCGLMDQMACAVGGVVFIDFKDPEAPVVERIDVSFEDYGYRLCILDVGAGHANLTGEYAAIPGELKQVAAHFGKQVLRQVPEQDFYREIPALRAEAGDRAVLRAIHVYEENKRVVKMKQALLSGDFEAYLRLVRASGRSSWMYLQNISPSGSTGRQEMAVALALCERQLRGKGAVRVHGGGFGGTVQIYVPTEQTEDFIKEAERVFGTGCCKILNIYGKGGTLAEEEKIK